MDTTPVSLLERLTRGHDPSDWDRFVRLFLPLLDRWLRALHVPASEADDLLQEIFLILLRRLPTFDYDPEKSFRRWLWRVTVNAWHDLRPPRNPVPSADGRLEPPTTPDFVEALCDDEFRRYVVGRTLQILKSDFAANTWQAFWETTVEGRPGVEVARALGMSENAVYLARGRVLSRLRQELHGLAP